MFDQHKNFAYSTVITAPVPSDTGGSLVVGAGNGALFPTPPFNAVVWPANANPNILNAEVVRVTGITTDTFTIVRHQEGTTAKNIGVGYQIMAAITSKTLQDIENLLSGATAGAVLSSPTLTTPSISSPAVSGGSFSGNPNFSGAPSVSSFANAQHDHHNAASGGLLGAGVVQNSMLSTAVGEPGGAWNTFSPTLQNITLGNGSMVARYRQIGKTVDFYVMITLGSTSAIVAACRTSLPVPAKASYFTGVVLSGYCVDIGVTNLKDDSASAVWAGPAMLVDANTCTLDIWQASGTYLQAAGCGPTVPFTWTTNDCIAVCGRYEAA